MRALVTALYAEGRTDERFLPRIIQRTAVDLLNQRGREVVDVLAPTLLTLGGQQTRAESILAAAQEAHGYHILFVHADADDDLRERAYVERVEPGIRRVYEAQANGWNVCTDLTPIIPVQATEAWLLADADALREVIGTNASNADLAIPIAPREIEGLADPKQRLIDIVRQSMAARPRRRRRLNIGEIYEPMAERLHLVQLQRLPAYRQFVDDFVGTLARLGFIEQPHDRHF